MNGRLSLSLSLSDMSGHLIKSTLNHLHNLLVGFLLDVCDVAIYILQGVYLMITEKSKHPNQGKGSARYHALGSNNIDL